MSASRIGLILGLVVGGLYALALAGADIDLTAGSAKVIKKIEMEKVAIGNSDVADVKQISDDELLITGKTAGSTSLIVWKKNGRKDISMVIVKPSKSDNVMVQVDVQVMELTKTDGLDVGFDWEKMVGSATQLTLRETTAPLKAIGTLERGQLALALKLLVEKGHAKILAKPKLVSLSGKAAQFSSGGEIPVPVVNELSQVSVSWKSYGVKLDILPTVMGDDEINVDVRAEVSDVDFTHLVQGNPAIKTRWASATIQVKPRSTVVIGGLIQEKNQTLNQGVPVLSDIPIIGQLFKSTRYSKETSELVIFVTPQIIGG